MKYLLITTVATIFSCVSCGDHTITDEAWFDVLIKNLDGPGQDYKGRFTVGLFGDAAPMTVLNFRSIAKGYRRGKELFTYNNTKVHRIVPDFVVQMGDITTGDGTGGKSIFGSAFNDEEFILSHRSPGWVAMANHGPDTNGSQFYISMARARWLDGKHVVFGKVIQGMDVINTLGDVKADRHTGRPKKSIKIVACGVNDVGSKYDLTEDQLDSSSDI